MKRHFLKIILTGLIILAFSTVEVQAWPKWLPFGKTSEKTSEKEITDWANQYCSIASTFIKDFMVDDIQPTGSWEDTMVYLNHYKRTRDAAESAISKLNRLDAPEEAQKLHSTTINVLREVQYAAKEGIKDVENSSNRGLFAIAVNEYRRRLAALSKKMEDETEQSSLRIREKLQSCTIKLL